MIISWKAGATAIRAPCCSIPCQSNEPEPDIATLFDRVRINYAGFVIVMALILGGGTTQHLWTDHLIEILMLPAMVTGFLYFDRSRLDGTSRFLVFAVIVIALLQFFPLFLFGGGSSPDMFLPDAVMWTSSVFGSLDAVSFALPLTGFFLFVSCFGDREQEMLLRFVLLGFAINLLTGIIQLSYGSAIAISDVLPFTITSALFANQNHFSTLVFAMIPLLAWRFLWAVWRPVIYCVISLLTVGFLFAVGSRAGMGISTALAVFCLLWKISEGRGSALRLATIALLAIAAFVSFIWLGTGEALEADLRSVFYRNTLSAIAGNWLTGTGLGSFVFVYPAYEPQEDIVRVFANHAHNDYLELMLELGIVFIPLLALFVFQILRYAGRSPLAQAATISIIAVMVHSIVDYPLRTMAIATVFGVLSAMVLSRNGMTVKPASGGLELPPGSNLELAMHKTARGSRPRSGSKQT